MPEPDVSGRVLPAEEFEKDDIDLEAGEITDEQDGQALVDGGTGVSPQVIFRLAPAMRARARAKKAVAGRGTTVDGGRAVSKQ